MPPDVAAKLIAYARSKGHALTFDDVYAEPETPKKAKRVAALKLSKAAA